MTLTSSQMWLKRRNKVNNIVKDVLLKENLKVNNEKTEHTILIRKNATRNEDKKKIEPWRSVVKLGSMLGDSDDIAHRKQLSNNAMNKMNNVWFKKDKIKVDLRIKMYKTLIKPILLYNSSTWSMSETENNNINAFHRRQLRLILNVKYPETMKNKDIYHKTNEKPISLDIIASRWRLFGHTLRMNEESPAHKAMVYYFSPPTTSSFIGRPRITLPYTLSQDLEKTASNNNVEFNRYGIDRLKSNKDFEKLKLLAKDRNKWKQFSMMIYKTAEAETRISEMN